MLSFGEFGVRLQEFGVWSLGFGPKMRGRRDSSSLGFSALEILGSGDFWALEVWV